MSAVTGAIAVLRRNHDVAGPFGLALVSRLGGGRRRDILVHEDPLIFRAGQSDALATGTGSVAGTFLFRVAAIQHDGRTSPLRRGR